MMKMLLISWSHPGSFRSGYFYTSIVVGDTVANTAIQITTNNGGAWNIISLPQAGASSDFRATIAGQVVTDVTDTGQVKFKLDIDNLNGTTMKGSTDYNYTYVLMKKLGET